jgi:hypothetical protein
MLKRDWSKVNESSRFIDSQMLLRDIKNGQLIEKFMSDYDKMALDVVSIA